MNVRVADYYPKARKLQYDLKNQLTLLESCSSNKEMQDSARQSLNEFSHLIGTLERAVEMESGSTKEMWIKKIQQLKQDCHFLGGSLEEYLFRIRRNAAAAEERKSLLSRRFTSNDNANMQANMYATQEHESLQRSTNMVTDLMGISEAVLSNLGDQSARLKV